MKAFKNGLLLLVTALLSVSCIGDQNTVIGQEFEDSDFVNENFKGNKKNFSDLPKDLCEFLDEASILKGYNNATSVLFNGNNSFVNKNCQFSVIFFNDQSQYIIGTLFINEDTYVEDWKDHWEMKKKRFRSAEYIKNLGMAAIWNGKQRTLDIKMKGYTVVITVPSKMIAKNKLDTNANVKDIAIAIANSTNLF